MKHTTYIAHYKNSLHLYLRHGWVNDEDFDLFLCSSTVFTCVSMCNELYVCVCVCVCPDDCCSETADWECGWGSGEDRPGAERRWADMNENICSGPADVTWTSSQDGSRSCGESDMFVSVSYSNLCVSGVVQLWQMCREHRHKQQSIFRACLWELTFNWQCKCQRTEV